MPSKLTLDGHPLHPMLTGFPILFYTASFISFVTYSLNGNLFWFQFGYTTSVAGVLTAIVLLVPALSELMMANTKNKPALHSGEIHISMEFMALILFAVNLWLQGDKWAMARPSIEYAMPLTGFGLLLSYMAGFFGWDLDQGHVARF